MFGTYLRRELLGRRRQTVIVSVGMAVAIALVIVVDALSAGVRQAQAQVLESVYGVGTDITITQQRQPGEAAERQGPRFDVGAGEGQESDGSREVHQSRLAAAPGSQTMDASVLATTSSVPGVAGAAAVLRLESTSFDGVLPDFSRLRQGGPGGGGQGQDAGAPSGGADGAGGSSFTVDSFSVLGVDPGGDSVGPLSAVTLAGGRALAASDAGEDVVVLDGDYARSKDLAVGDTLAIGGTDFSVVGVVAPSGSDAETAADAYIPLDVAQGLSGEEGKVSAVYVSAESAAGVDGLKSALEKRLPEATVSTQTELAAQVSGSLGSAASLLGGLGTWLSVIVLAAAFLTAILFTVSGVARRTREFGTLKALGWSNGRIVGQVTGESVVQAVIGGAVGVLVGFVATIAIDLAAPTLTGGLGGTGGRMLSAGSAAQGAPGGLLQGGAGGFRGAGGFDGLAQQPGAAGAASDVVLHAPLSLWIVAAAVGLAIVGGLLAGAVGGWRASRLRPAEALRSIG